MNVFHHVVAAGFALAILSAPLALADAPRHDLALHAPEVVSAGQEVNVFLRWAPRDAVEGFRLELPMGWRIESALATRDGGSSALPLEVRQLRDGLAALVLTTPARGPLLVVIRVAVGQGLGYGTLSASARAVGALEFASVRTNVRVQEPPPRDNRVFQLGQDVEPLQIRRRVVPQIGPRSPLTVEFWIRTLAVNEVVLSTWDGDPTRPYPLEVIVDGVGRLAAYRGMPGYHEAVVSAQPVADGTWRHVALTRNPDEGLARLLIDGIVVDSLRLGEVHSHNAMPLAIGGRPLRPGGQHEMVFSGQLDELRIWPTARPVAGLRTAMRLPLEAPPEGVLRLGFEEPIPERWLVRPTTGPTTARGDLAFGYPIEQFQADLSDGTVELRWEARDSRLVGFRIERSADGQAFESIAEIDAGDQVFHGANGARRYIYTDLAPSGNLVYYRIRQVDQAGTERVTGALKVGLGPEDPDAVLAIRGNSPNPFRHQTVLSIDLPRSGPIQLSVWTLAGTRAAVVFEGHLTAGTHRLQFDADGLSSGVYFARLETDYGTAAHRMTLMP